MEFCPKCGAILVMKVKRAGCPNCNYVAKGKVDMEMKEDVDEGTSVAVVSNKDASVNPTVNWKCRSCGHGKAEFWMRQMRSGDEPESQFYKCVKCGKTEMVDDRVAT